MQETVPGDASCLSLSAQPTVSGRTVRGDAKDNSETSEG
jgi:hypothetical protein